MRNNIPLGRIAGITVTCNWSVLIIGLLFAANLAGQQFPNAVPGLSDGAYWLAAGFGVVLFFFTLLAHEMGHALVARREGVGVQSVELWLLGGLTRFQHQPETAGAELRISLAGPAATAASGGLFLLLANLTTRTGGSLALLSEVFVWLGVINLSIAVLNLIPASPLDGGRVLSSLVWMKTGNQSRGVRIAAGSGRVVGAAIIGLGAWMLLAQGDEFGLWLAIVGAFISMSAAAELRRAPVIERLQGLRVGDVMSGLPGPVPDWLPLDQFLRDLDPNTPYLTFPVTDMHGQFVGLLSASRVRGIDPAQFGRYRVGDLTAPSAGLLRVAATDSLLSTLQRLEGSGPDAMVVWPDGRPAGVVGVDTLQRVLSAR